jgi:hypothetical protein
MEDQRLNESLTRELSRQLDRRTLLTRWLALAVGALPAASLLAACGDGDGMMDDGLPDWMMSGLTRTIRHPQVPLFPKVAYSSNGAREMKRFPRR